MSATRPATVPAVPPKLYTVDEAEALTGFDIRHLIFQSTPDGKHPDFAEVVVRHGRVVRLRADKLAEWIDRRTGIEPFNRSATWREKNALAFAKRALAQQKQKAKSKKRQRAQAGR